MDDVGERDFWAKIIISGFLDDFCSSPKIVYSFGGFNQSGNSKENLWKIYMKSSGEKHCLQMVFSWFPT